MNELQKNLVKYEAFKLKDYSDGNYPNVIESDFPEYKSFLPITAQDFQYVMDIMHISGFGEEMERSSRSGKRTTFGVTVHVKNIENPDAGDYKTALVFVETTSRKAWVYQCMVKMREKSFRNLRNS